MATFEPFETSRTGHGLTGAPWTMLSLYPSELPTIRKPPAGFTHPAGKADRAPTL